MSIMTKIRSLGGKLMRRGMRLIPVSKRYIMFESELDYAESARAIYDYMIRHQMNKKYHLIWSVKDSSLYPPEKNVVFICRDAGSIRWNYYLNRCKYFIFTHPWWMTQKKKSQIRINTAHGTMPLKGASKNPVVTFDYMLAGTEMTADYRNRAWGRSKAYIPVPLDMPRNDWLYDTGNYLAPFLKGKHYSKVILCMPTFKQSKHWSDSNEQNPYLINVVQSRDDIMRLNQYLTDKNLLLVCKLHHLQTLDTMTSETFSNILYLRDEQLSSNGIMINHVLTCSDALVTDFSSVCFDYLLLDRPIGFFVNSVEQYHRGYMMENPEDFMPGTHIHHLDDFLSFMDVIVEGKDNYTEFRHKLRAQCFRFTDNGNCRRFIEYFKF